MTATLDPIARPALSDAAAAVVPMEVVRSVQQAWAAVSVRDRLKPLRALRHLIAANGESLAQAIPTVNRTLGEKIVSEVLPLAEAIRFLERRAAKALRPVRWGSRSRPLWLWGITLTVYREPLGVVLIVAPSNYPLLLLGVQMVQALAAGNAVLLKSAPGCSDVVRQLVSLTREAGFPAGLITLLPPANRSVADAIGAGVDKVLFTGSGAAGKAVLGLAAEAGIPATVELSGNDLVVICPDADLDLAARAVAFGLRFNAGATCVAPGRVFVEEPQLEPFLTKLAAALDLLEPVVVDNATVALLRSCLAETIERGGRVVCGRVDDDGTVRPVVLVQPAESSQLLGEGVFGPILVVKSVAECCKVLHLDTACPFHLGATVFGGPEAVSLAKQINAGVAVVNDMLVPHADPRLPFGGRGASGFGVTRGIEGLLELTRPKAISVRGGKRRPHLQPAAPAQGELFNRYLQLRHGRGLGRRLAALSKLLRAGSKLK